MECDCTRDGRCACPCEACRAAVCAVVEACGRELPGGGYADLAGDLARANEKIRTLEAKLEERHDEFARRLHDVVSHRCLTAEQRRLLFDAAYPDIARGLRQLSEAGRVASHLDECRAWWDKDATTEGIDCAPDCPVRAGG